MSHFRAVDDLASQASVHLALSSVYRSRRELLPDSRSEEIPIALSHAGNALDWAYSARDRPGEARAAADLANHYLAIGELPTAMDYCAKALELSIQIGHVTGQVDALDTLGRIHADLGDYERAISYFLDALDTCSGAGIPVRPPHILESLGDAYLASGNQAAARTTWQELIEYARRLQRTEHPWMRESRVLSKLERITPAEGAEPREPAAGEPPPGAHPSSELPRWSPAPAS
jgi:tetratricopeptide (TPR) repeat protein